MDKTRLTEDLVFRLLNGLEEDREVRQGLFPGPGANASSAGGGGKTKTEFYWKLATELFAGHEVYGAPFAIAQGSSAKKARAPWVLKVKNQLTRYVA
jgi:hypothetical protein